MMKKLFTERRDGLKPRVQETLDEFTRAGLLVVVSSRIKQEWFGNSFPFLCQDGQGNAGCDISDLKTMMTTYDVVWPDDAIGSSAQPTDGEMFDLLEFSYQHVAEPDQGNYYHSYHNHYHYDYDVDAGREKFQQEVNRIFERNGIAFSLEAGEIVRIAPAILHESLSTSIFNTGDGPLNELLETARAKFLNRSLNVRLESLEKLWDAWERLKTVEPGKDKKASATALLDKAATESTFRDALEQEAGSLTTIGNKFMIRHTETDKVPITSSEHVDYLFHRMFSLIRLLLRSSSRGG
jgi:AbiJ N-terminal domain 4